MSIYASFVLYVSDNEKYIHRTVAHPVSGAARILGRAICENFGTYALYE